MLMSFGWVFGSEEVILFWAIGVIVLLGETPSMKDLVLLPNLWSGPVPPT